MEALVQVHALNLLHRDISPDNIYITSKGESRLLDFGAARFALGDGKSVSVILKHGYAPEEQYSSHGNQGPWTDVYAMGATLYRCITGQLPPDSVERIHGDTMKRPSELGFRIPANVENAIMKALAVKTEDRFPNMEAFIGALNGRVSVQDQVAASISQRTQATAYRQEGYGQIAYQQPAYNGGGAAAGKPSAFSRFLSYMKANPVVAWVSGGGLLAVIALCIILPIALSGGGEKGRQEGAAVGIRLSSANLRLSSANRRRVIRNRQQTQSLLQNLQRKWWRRISASLTPRLRSRRTIRRQRMALVLSTRIKAALS